MRQILTNYSFNAATKEIDFSSYSGFDIQKLTAIINVNANQLIYQSGNPTFGYSSFAANVLTLVYDTTSMSNTDSLQVYYDNQSIEITDGAGVVNTKQIGTAITNTDVGLVSQTVIHGLSTGGGGSYVDVKVNPSGALVVDTGLPTNGQNTSANSFPVVIANEQSQDVMVIGQAGQSALNNNILLDTAGSGSIDTTINSNSSYRSFHCQIIGSAGISAGQIIFEGSNNNVTFFTIPWYDDSVVTGAVNSSAIAIAANANRFFSGKIGYRYIRCRISTAFVGGTVQAITRFSSALYIQRVLNVAQSTGGSFSTTISASLPTGTGAIGDVGIQYRANATGAASKLHLVSAASTNATIVKASAGRLLGWSLANTTASFVYLKLHNQATLPTAGASVFMTIALPPNSVSQLSLAGGIAFTTGIGITTVTGAADSDTTAVAANDIVGDLFFT